MKRAIVTLLIIMMTVITGYAGQVPLAWNRNTEGPEVDGYRLYYGTESGVYDNSIDVGNATTCVIQDIPEGVKYYYAVTAYNSDNESKHSDEVSFVLGGTNFKSTEKK